MAYERDSKVKTAAMCDLSSALYFLRRRRNFFGIISSSSAPNPTGTPGFRG